MTQETKCRPRVSHAAASARNKITVRPARSPAPQRWAVAARACAVSVQEFEVEENIDFSVLTGRSSFCLQRPSGHPFVSFLFPFSPSPLSPSIPFLFIPVLILSHLYAPHQPDAVSRQFRFSVPELPSPGIGAKKKKKTASPVTRIYCPVRSIFSCACHPSRGTGSIRQSLAGLVDCRFR